MIFTLDHDWIIAIIYLNFIQTKGQGIVKVIVLYFSREELLFEHYVGIKCGRLIKSNTCFMINLLKPNRFWEFHYTVKPVLKGHLFSHQRSCYIIFAYTSVNSLSHNQNKHSEHMALLICFPCTISWKGGYLWAKTTYFFLLSDHLNFWGRGSILWKHV